MTEMLWRISWSEPGLRTSFYFYVFIYWIHLICHFPALTQTGDAFSEAMALFLGDFTHDGSQQ